MPFTCKIYFYNAISYYKMPVLIEGISPICGVEYSIFFNSPEHEYILGEGASNITPE